MSKNTKAIDKDIYEKAMKLLNSGKRTIDVATELGLNWSTVNNWKQRNGRIRKFIPEFDVNSLIKNENNKENYSYLLGMYLGCGVISDLRKTYALRIYLNKKIPISYKLYRKIM